MNQDIDAKLKDRYSRAYDICSGLGGGSWELIIQVAKDIKEEEERLYKSQNKDDVGGIGDTEEEKKKEAEAKREADEEEAWDGIAPSMDLPVPPKKKEQV